MRFGKRQLGLSVVAFFLFSPRTPPALPSQTSPKALKFPLSPKTAQNGPSLEFSPLGGEDRPFFIFEGLRIEIWSNVRFYI